MKVLHLIKSVAGASWAARQIKELVAAGIEIHVALPAGNPGEMQKWIDTGATLHFVNLDFPVRAPWTLSSVLTEARELVEEVRPDLIHSHFFGPTIVMRYALGKDHSIPRIFQVPGPLHLEHLIFRTWEVGSAGKADHWIASSYYIRGLYLKAGVAENRVQQSYYGVTLPAKKPERSFALHRLLGIPETQKIIGNVSYIYKPKYYLGQTKGIKRHEDLIDAIAEVTRARPDVTGVLIGGAWQGAEKYERRLRKMARDAAGDRIRMMGTVPSESILSLWADFDLAIHVPISENCGGVVEPLLAGVTVIGSEVGGIPEVIENGVTGTLVPTGNQSALARSILENLDRLSRNHDLALAGEKRVRNIFDIHRTSSEIAQVYLSILSSGNESNLRGALS
ncbi:MAG: glycosyltransferase family 4 protein [Cryobacterium sp.]|nr:glycosyltransferase family 4 protein [Oligoflexia bacterium]